jgi:phosphoribosylformylglycinamidine synthase I
VSPRVGVVLFPGTNCEHDVVEALSGLGAEASLVWHGATSLGDVDAVVLPGGFAHGDYLRPGAIARFSPVMAAVSGFAAAGGPVVGICNGFQILTEAHLLPGALQKNAGLRFLCAPTELEVASDTSVLTAGVAVGTRLSIPINHFEGNYLCDPATLDELRAEGRIVLRYVDNPNGSVDDIAGIANAAGNVVGLMPHPERASDPLLGSTDGRILLAARRVAAGAGAGAGAVLAGGGLAGGGVTAAGAGAVS